MVSLRGPGARGTADVNAERTVVRDKKLIARLRYELDRATSAYAAAREQYQRALNDGDIPDVSHSNRQLLISFAFHVEQAAREQWRDALQRYTDYLLRGKVPD